MSASCRSAVPFSLGFAGVFDRLLGLSELQRRYESLPPGDFVQQALASLDIHADVSHLDRVPREGGALIVVNHPTGAMDGLLVLAALREARRDVRVLGNRWLSRIPEMREWTIPLDLYTALPSQHLAAIRQARRFVGDGGVLVLFPAGAVARHCDGHRAVEQPWSPGVLALARWTEAPIVPVHLAACPSPWLRAAQWVHPWLGTAMLPRELLRQRGRRVTVSVGHAVDATRLESLPDAHARLAYLRARVSALASSRQEVTEPAPLAPEVLSSLVAREVAALPADACLLEHGRFQVFCAEAAAIPLTLREIGRLRERTFRDVGEGTGRSVDLDGFDRHYLHLFLWNRTRAEIAGAYRMAPARPQGLRLYTQTLFAWRGSPHAHLGDALELGRSFVRAEYQRDPSALLLLWRGIGAFASRHPNIRHLFGPVSVSAEYSGAARYLIAAWLMRHASAPGPVLSKHTVPAYQDVDDLLAAGAAPTLADVDRLVRELEDGRGLPVLLRQYLRLNGRVLAVSRDPAFADAMDALLVVDMLDMPASHLERYCGRAGAARIRRHWGAEAGDSHKVPQFGMAEPARA
jgi:putative hemolysin